MFPPTLDGCITPASSPRHRREPVPRGRRGGRSFAPGCYQHRPGAGPPPRVAGREPEQSPEPCPRPCGAPARELALQERVTSVPKNVKPPHVPPPAAPDPYAVVCGVDLA